MATVCKTCGGPVNRTGNYYVCEYCRNKWEVDSSNDVHAVERANAWSALRDGDFEKAAELFENIIMQEQNNHEAYWGRALALGGIIYVTDMNENKKVPTCNNITENSFINDKDVQKAISLAPNDIAESYKTQAEYIEKVRVEWLEKASKEPSYDVFISFKDSDRENGIERTQDSIDAQDLYNALIEEGYKVFFSRISLRDKISEQYEPYIYNAIKTAKVMIVFGEKPEYFSSVWIKNEWSRFKKRIEKGEKHKNSLVVVYKNMNPGDLPVVLKSRQCLNASDMTFLSDLNRHIKRVVDESKKNVQLERIEIKGGQIAKKATSLEINVVETREVGTNSIVETSISEKQSISLIYDYLKNEHWKEGTSLVEDVLFNNPNCAEAIWCQLLIKYKVPNNEELIEKINNFDSSDYGIIEKILNCASKEFAKEILILLYQSGRDISDIAYKSVLEIILPFMFDERQDEIKNAFDDVINYNKYNSFKLLLNTLQISEVEKYISYNYKYAIKTSIASDKKECLDNVLKVDEGNINALRENVVYDLENSKPIHLIIKDFEELLRYTKDIKSEINFYMEWLCNDLSTTVHCEYAKQLLRYYNGAIDLLKDNIKKLVNKMLEKKLFNEVEYFLNLLITFDESDIDAYWNICLMKSKVTSQEELFFSDIQISDLPEFNKYLTLVDEKRRKECLELLKVQKFSKLRKKYELAQQLLNTTYWGFTLSLNVHTLLISYIGEEKSYWEPKLQEFLNKEGIRIKRIWGKGIVQTVDNEWFVLGKRSGRKCCFFKDGFKYNKNGLIYCLQEAVYYALLYNNGKLMFFNEDWRSDELDEEIYQDWMEGCFVNDNKIMNSDIDYFRKRKDIVQTAGSYALLANGHILIQDVTGIREIKGLSDVVQIVEFAGLRGLEIGVLQNGTVIVFNGEGVCENSEIEEIVLGCDSVLYEEDELEEICALIKKVKECTDIISVVMRNNVSTDDGWNYELICLKKDGTIIKIFKDGWECVVKTFSDIKCFNNFDTIIEDYEASINKYRAGNKSIKNSN